MKYRLPSVLLLFAVLLGRLPAAAQTDLHDWKKLENVAAGTELWVKTTEGACTAQLESVNDEELRLVRHRRILFVIHADRPYRIPRAEVREVRYGHRALSQLAGAAIGVGAGAGIGAIVDARARNRVEEGHIGGVTLGFLGGILGAATGENHPFIKGKKIYVAP